MKPQLPLLSFLLVAIIVNMNFSDIIGSLRNAIGGLFNRGQEQSASPVHPNVMNPDQAFRDKGLIKLTDTKTGEETWMSPETARKIYPHGWSDNNPSPSPSPVAQRAASVLGVTDKNNSNPNWDEFMRITREQAEKRGYDADTVIRQKALESDFGRSRFAKERNNYGGIGAYDADPNKAFNFDNIQAYLDYYFNLIENRYPEAYANRANPQKYIQGLKEGNYATDPDYIDNILRTGFYPREDPRYGAGL